MKGFGAAGGYYCDKCKRSHERESAVGKRHVSYASAASIGKPTLAGPRQRERLTRLDREN